MQRNHLPIWFRAVFAGLFAVLFGAFLLLRGGGAPAAFARSLLERAAPRIRPVLNTDAAIASASWRAQPRNGAYRLNGMRVEYHTFKAPATATEVVERFEKAFKKAGYKTKRIVVQGQATLVGLHPKTNELLTVRPTRTEHGSIVRLTQQNLGELREGFKAEIPGVPVFPGGEGNTLVESEDGTPSKTFSFVARSDGDFVAQLPMPSMVPPDSPLKVFFFAKEGRECSVMLFPAEVGTTVGMVSVSGNVEG
jgi:hypothetical protein